DDVSIDTPVGSIGIRGTIIMGDVETGEITVVEGAIVLRDFQGHEVTLASQFESAKFVPGDGIESMGTLSAHEVGTKFASVSTVSGTLFSSINDVAAEPLVAIASEPAPEETIVASADTETQQPAPSAETQPQPQLAETIVQPVTQPL